MMRSFLPENKMNNSNDTLLRMMHAVKVNIILQKPHQKFVHLLENDLFDMLNEVTSVVIQASKYVIIF